jgi:tRNA(Ile)-lysidine synthase
MSDHEIANDMQMRQLQVFEDTCLATIESYQLMPRGEKVLVALSGGPDSVAMLHYLVQLAPLFDAQILAVHVNHMLRGSQSDEDARFCEHLCSSLKAPLVTRLLDVRALCARTGLGVQEAARQGRYEILVEEAIKAGAGTVAVGQNLDDQAETVLLRLVRGTGPAGLAGIWPKRKFVTQGGLGPVTLVRPLLGTSRQEILDYLQRHEVAFRTDPTNLKPDYARNFVRLKVMLLLKEINPAAPQAIARLAELLLEQQELFHEQVSGIVDQVEVTASGSRVKLSLVLSLSRAGQRYLARQAIEKAKGDLRRINRDHVDAVLNVARGHAEACELAGGIVVRNKQGWLSLEAGGLHTPPAPFRWEPVEIACPGRTSLSAAGYTVDARIVARASLVVDPAANDDPNRAYLDLAEVLLPVRARQRRDGDAFSPLGMRGTKKVKDFLISQQVPPAQRDLVPIIVDARDSILWLGGLRIDHRARVTSTTEEVLVLSLEKAS